MEWEMLGYSYIEKPTSMAYGRMCFAQILDHNLFSSTKARYVVARFTRVETRASLAFGRMCYAQICICPSGLAALAPKRHGIHSVEGYNSTHEDRLAAPIGY
jgi:hypothetical protein